MCLASDAVMKYALTITYKISACAQCLSGDPRTPKTEAENALTIGGFRMMQIAAGKHFS
jgi:hypothetical protein